MRYAFLAALLAIGCATAPPRAEPPGLTIPAEEGVDAVVAAEEHRAQLAIEVALTRDGVQPLDAVIVYGPQKANAAVEDLAVRIGAAEQTLYTMADPRIAEVDAKSTLILPAARVWIYAPIDGDVSIVGIVPLRTRHPEASRGGSFDARPLRAAACRKAQHVPDCGNVAP